MCPWKRGKSIVPSEIIDSFLHYMAQENTNAERAELIELLRGHLRDSGFLNDMRPLLRTGLHYDPLEAGEYVLSRLLDLLPAADGACATLGNLCKTPCAI